MATRREITKKYASDYAKSSKNAKGSVLDVRKRRGRTYGYDTLKVLISVWRLAGMPSGKYLAATMDLWLPKLQAFGELDATGLTPAVRAQLLKISGATIDRILKPTRDADGPKGLSATRAGAVAAELDHVRKAGDEHEQAPGFIEADMVVHCGPTLAGEFARTLTATDVFTGWTENVAVPKGAHKWVLEAMDEIVARLPFPMVGLDTDNGGEFINHALISWAGDKDIYFTRSRRYTSNDNADVEHKNGDVMRRHAPRYRYDTAAELKLLNALYALVRVRLNLFTATTKAIGWRSNKHGKKTRIYDKTRTPYQRVIDSGILTEAKAAELAHMMTVTNPADLTRGISTIQTQLITLAAAKTQALEASSTRAQIAEARTTHSRTS